MTVITKKHEGKNVIIKDGSLVRVLRVGAKYAFCVPVFDAICPETRKIKMLKICKKKKEVVLSSIDTILRKIRKNGPHTCPKNR